MPWAAAAAVASAALGASASNKASKAGAAASDRASQANAWQGEIAREQHDDYKSIYQPLERELVADSKNFDSEAAYDQAAAEAQEAVSSQLGLAKERLDRAPGMDPTSAAAQAARVSLELKGAALGAREQNRARTAVTDKAYARKLDAVGLGKGLVASASTGMANAASTASSIAANANAQAGQTAAGVGSMVGGVMSGLSKVNWGGSGTAGYDQWKSNNSGVMNSTGLSESDLAGAL